MFISTAYAQAAGGAAGGSSMQALLPLVLIFVVFYFLLIRPQQKKMKQHREMLGAIRRGDKVVTGGGIIGTVAKVDNENELTVEIAKDVKVKVNRELISAVLSKTEPQAGQAKPANEDKPQGGLLGRLLGGGAKPRQPAANEPAEKPEAANDEPAAEDAKTDAEPEASEPSEKKSD
jgi:preprotein translocase subunit YajC